jgi:phosphoribosylanthranilate isomerase
MKLKVCGLKYPDNIQEVAALEPDFMGFIFYKPSPRYFGGPDASVLSAIPSNIIKTAVFVNEPAGSISNLIEKYGFSAIQLHGAETPEFCKKFKGKVLLIKAFGIDDSFDFNSLKGFSDVVDLFLFDAKTPIHGGSGKSFNWELLNNYTLDIPFFLSGGISPENLEERKRIGHPKLYGVDLNSKFETAPGLKDIAKLEKAFDLIKHTTNEIRG